MIDFKKIKIHVKDKLGRESSGHNFHHVNRVYLNALRISKAEKNCDLDVVKGTALLHDMAYSKKFFPGKNSDTE